MTTKVNVKELLTLVGKKGYHHSLSYEIHESRGDMYTCIEIKIYGHTVLKYSETLPFYIGHEHIYKWHPSLDNDDVNLILSILYNMLLKRRSKKLEHIQKGLQTLRDNYDSNP